MEWKAKSSKYSSLIYNVYSRARHTGPETKGQRNEQIFLIFQNIKSVICHSTVEMGIRAYLDCYSVHLI